MKRRIWLGFTALVVAAVPALAAAVPARADTDGVPAPALAWTDCTDGYQCATTTAPLDYDDPHGRQINLSLIKQPATDPAHRIGTLFVNFGGPGASIVWPPISIGR